MYFYVRALALALIVRKGASSRRYLLEHIVHFTPRSQWVGICPYGFLLLDRIPHYNYLSFLRGFLASGLAAGVLLYINPLSTSHPRVRCLLFLIYATAPVVLANVQNLGTELQNGFASVLSRYEKGHQLSGTDRNTLLGYDTRFFFIPIRRAQYRGHYKDDAGLRGAASMSFSKCVGEPSISDATLIGNRKGNQRRPSHHSGRAKWLRPDHQRNFTAFGHQVRLCVADFYEMIFSACP